MSLLDIDKMRVEFPGRHGVFTAVNDVSLHVEPGEILGVVGESGAGKSTVGNALIDLLQPPGKMVAGKISLNDKRIDQFSDEKRRALRGKRIAMIFQDPLTSLNPIETIEFQLVETILQHLDMTKAEATARAIDLLEQVGIDDATSRIKQYPHQFSGGMRQRVVIALALCADPELIIADEPTTALDVSIQAQILGLIKKLCREKQVGVILVTHDMGVISETADRVAVMFGGALIETGTTKQILTDPQHEYTKGLISAVPPANKRIERFPQVYYIENDTSKIDKFDLKTHWLGQSEKYNKDIDYLLELQRVRKRFETKPALLKRNRKYVDAVKNVSLEIKPGETFGLVGESGSGKSTIARLITGIHPLDGGQMRFAGAPLERGRKGAEARLQRRQIQMVFQDPYSSLNARMRVRSIVEEPIMINGLLTSKKERREIVADLLELVGLGPDAGNKFPHEFSGGQRQRISIARALATRPRFLICDEPTSALDVSIQAQILNLLKDLQRELNLTMLFISHDLPVIRQMCDRIGVMRHGELLETADAEDLFNKPQHEYTKSLIDLMPKFEG